MNRHRRLIPRIKTLSAALLALALLGGCSEPRGTPEAEIERVLEEGAQALEARSLDALEELISDSYRDDRGRDKKTLLRTAFLVFRRGPIRVLRVGTEIEATPESGQARFTAHALQGREVQETPLDLLPQRVRGYRVVLHFIWEGDRWRVRRIEGVDDPH